MNQNIRFSFALAVALALAACAPAQTTTPAAAPTAVPPARVSAAATAPAQATALAQATAIPPTVAPTAAPANLFFARPQGDSGPLVAYDMTTGAMRFSLPPGRLSADGAHYLAAIAGADTRVVQFDLSSGAEAPVTQLAGQWELGSVSPSGRWAALRRLASDGEKQAWAAGNTWKTDLVVVDALSSQAARPIALAGNFEVDALSAAGDALFVIQYLPAVKPDHYQVRLFDLNSGSLQDGALVDKRAPDEVMAGQRSQAVATRDGSWVFTLYLRTKNNTAFIHALNTEYKYTLCFDLPTLPGNSLDQLRAYTLALSPGGQLVYAANPALGIVARVDLNAYDVSSLASFAPDGSALSLSAPVNFSVSDGRWVYFTGGKNVWSYDNKTQQVKSLSALDTLISGLGLSVDGQRLWVARAGQPALMLDTTSGQALGSQ